MTKKQGTPRADSWEEIQKHLPSAEEERKIANEMEELYPKTNRSGARTSVSAGSVPAIRPRGLKRTSDFIDKHTPGKLKLPKRAFSTELPEGPEDPAKKELKEKLKMILPRSFCPDCGRTDRPHKGGAINPNFCTEDTPHLGLKAFDIYVTFFCQECLEKAILKQKRTDPADNLIVGGYTNKEIKDAERMVRIKENTHGYIKARLAAGDHAIYVSGKRED
jgi:hypothetical protein